MVLGGLIWLPARRPACLPHSSSARSGFPVTKPPFRSSTSSRAGMVRPDQDRIGSEACDHAEVDETWVGGRTRGKGRGVPPSSFLSPAPLKCDSCKPGTKLDKRKGGRYAGRVRLAVVPDRSAESLCGFVEGAVTSGASVITDDWSGYTSLAKRGYKHLAVAERGNSQVAEEYLPIIHLVFSNLKTWLSGIHHGVSHHTSKPTSTSSPSASTGGSTRSTPSGP